MSEQAAGGSPTMNLLKGGNAEGTKTMTESEVEAAAEAAAEVVQAETQEVEKSKPATTKKKTGAKSTDLIESTSAEVEQLTKAKALKMATDLVDERGFNIFKLGGVLAKINDEAWYKDAGYETFAEYCEQVHEMKYRRAMYMIGIYTDLLNSGVAWKDVKSVGWSKLKEFAGELTPVNVKEWVARAKEMTTDEIKAYIKAEKAKAAGNADDTPPVAAASMTFKLHDDQKENIQEALEKAKTDFGTEYASQALHHLCMAYVGGQLGKASVSLTEVIKSAGAEATVEVLNEVFPDLELGGDSDGEALTLNQLMVAVGAEESVSALNAVFPELEVPASSIADLMKGAKEADPESWQQVLEAFAETWPEVDVEVTAVPGT